MRNADLTGFFDRNYSVESLRRYKPAQEMYRMVAADAVAALSGRYHAWDVLGAMQANCAAVVARPG